MLTSKQASVELNVSRLERGLAIMRDAPWRKKKISRYARPSPGRAGGA